MIAEAGEVGVILHEDVAGVDPAFAPGTIEEPILHADGLGVPPHLPDFVQPGITAAEGAEGPDRVLRAGYSDPVQRDAVERSADDDFHVACPARVHAVPDLASLARDGAFGHAGSLVRGNGLAVFQPLGVGEVDYRSLRSGELETGAPEYFATEIVEKDRVSSVRKIAGRRPVAVREMGRRIDVERFQLIPVPLQHG